MNIKRKKTTEVAGCLTWIRLLGTVKVPNKFFKMQIWQNVVLLDDFRRILARCDRWLE